MINEISLIRRLSFEKRSFCLNHDDDVRNETLKRRNQKTTASVSGDSLHVRAITIYINR